MVSTINGDANVPFLQRTGQPERFRRNKIPVVAFSVGIEELSGLDTKPLLGHLAAWNYFESISAPANKAFIDQWHTFIKNPETDHQRPDGGHHYIGFNLWVEGGDEGRIDRRKRRCWAALPGTGDFPNLTGGIAKVLPNHHITKGPVYIGESEGGWPVQRGPGKSTGNGHRAMPGPTFCPAARTLKGGLGDSEMRQL